MNAVLNGYFERSTIQIVPFSDTYLKDALVVAREIHARSLYRDLPLDEMKLVRQLQSCGHLVPDRYFRLAVRGQRVLGGFYGCVHRVFFCDELMAKDLGWWVREEARGSSAAMRLLMDFEDWARAKGARKVGLGQTGVTDIERTKRLFEHCGYRVTGYNVAKDLT
jgi:GNAT superfamily N-acetyltransferase